MKLGIAFSCTARIFLESDVEIQVQLILNVPMPAGQHIEMCGFGKVFIADIITDSIGCMLSIIHCLCNLDQGFQTKPSSRHICVFNGGNIQYAAVVGLDTSVIRIHLWGRVKRLVIAEGIGNLLVQGSLIILDGKKIMCSFI